MSMEEEEVAHSAWEGRIKKTFVELKEGTVISKGQPLFQLIKPNKSEFPKVKIDAGTHSATPQKTEFPKVTNTDTSSDSETHSTSLQLSESNQLKMEKQEEEYFSLTDAPSLSASLRNYEAHLLKLNKIKTQPLLPSKQKMESNTQSPLPSEPSKQKDVEISQPVVYEEVEGDDNTSEFARNYCNRLTDEQLTTLYSHWKCTVHKVFIQVGQNLKKGDACFVLCFKDTWGKDYPNDWPQKDDDKKKKEAEDQGDDDHPKNKRIKLQEEDATSDVAKSLSADSGTTSNPFDGDHLLTDGEWQYVFRIHKPLKVTELLVTPGMKVKKYQPLFNYECEKIKRVYDYRVPLQKVKQMALRMGQTNFYSEKSGFFFDFVKPNGEPYEPV